MSLDNSANIAAPEDYESVKALLEHLTHHPGQRIQWHTMMSVSIQERDGKYYHSVVKLTFDETGHFKFDVGDENVSKDMRDAIAQDFTRYSRPTPVAIPLWERGSGRGEGLWPDMPGAEDMPEMLSRPMLENPDNVWFYRRPPTEAESSSGQKCPHLTVIEVRVDGKSPDSPKHHYRWTKYSDGKWRCMVPEDFDWVWGIYEAKQDQDTAPYVIVHEGAKAAQAAKRRVQQCLKEEAEYYRKMSAATDEEKEALKKHKRWSDDLPESVVYFMRDAVHVGWVGGSNYANRVNWEAIAKLGKRLQAYEIVVVPDNDSPGKKVLKHAARNLVSFPGEVSFVTWLGSNLIEGWDFADPLISKNERKVRFGDFKNRIRPLVWATEVIGAKPNGDPIYGIRSKFCEYWCYHVRGFFFDLNRPKVGLKTQEFNRIVQSLSDVKDTAYLFSDGDYEPIHHIGFDPDRNEKKYVTEQGSNAMNQWRDFRPPAVRYTEGDNDWFWNFMRDRVQDDEYHVMNLLVNWIATVMLVPGIKLSIAPLLVGGQGIGKSLTMGLLENFFSKEHTAKINDTDLVNASYNEFLEATVVAFCHEVYQGQSWTAYRNLKSKLSFEETKINVKYGLKYDAEVRTKFMMATNEFQALMLEADDRRILVAVYDNVEAEDKAKFDSLIKDFVAGINSTEKLGKLRAEFEQLYDGTVTEMSELGYLFKESDKAPLTSQKKEMIANSHHPVSDKLEDYLSELGEGEFAIATDVMDEMAQKHPGLGGIKSSRNYPKFFEEAGAVYRSSKTNPMAKFRDNRKSFVTKNQEAMDLFVANGFHENHYVGIGQLKARHNFAKGLEYSNEPTPAKTLEDLRLTLELGDNGPSDAANEPM